MNETELFHLLALQSVEGIGEINAKKLINVCGSAKRVFGEKKRVLEKINGVGPYILKRLDNPAIFEKAAGELEFLEKENLEALIISDEGYPERLKQCIDAPLVLFKKGNFKINEQRVISIVGTRRMTNYGLAFLKEFLTEIKVYNPIIISGMAYGIDICAHREALNNNLSTVGILAHGLDRLYPKVHEHIANKMMEYGGLLTEFWSNTNPDKENFVKRNRIVAGISEATIVVESARKGGSLITADLAGSYHRDVFAVPGRASDKLSSGCNLLIKSNKAAMITSVKDLEYILNWKNEKKNPNSVQTSLFIELSGDEQKLFEYLKKKDKVLLDLLAIECNLTIQKSVSILLQLELKGLIKSLPGKSYQVVR